MNTKKEELLECVLNDTEIMQKANELSRRNQEKSRLEAEKKATTSSFAAKINTCDADIEQLALAISTRRESRPVECETKYNEPVDGQKTLIRTDTNEIVTVKIMTDNEKNDMFINATGEQEDGFVFNDRRTVPIVEKKDFKPSDAQTWESISQPMRAEDMVKAPLDKKVEYRVIKGEDNDSGALRYMLQKTITEPIDAEIVDDDKKPSNKKALPESKKQENKPENKLTFQFTDKSICPLIDAAGMNEKGVLRDYFDAGNGWETSPDGPYDLAFVKDCDLQTDIYKYRIIKFGKGKEVYHLQRMIK